MNLSEGLIQPLYQGADFIRAFQEFNIDSPGFQIAWLGQSGFLLQYKQSVLLFDPYLSDSLTEKYQATDKPHIRMTEKVVEPESLDFVDVVTSSHNHTDHLDASTLKPLISVNPDLAFIIPEANRDFVVQRLGCDPDWPIGLDHGQSVRSGEFEFHGVPAAHEDLAKDAAGRMMYMGYVVKFGPWTVYHSGDTILFEGMESILSQWKINLAILPINGRGPERRVSGNLWGREAAQLAKAISAEWVVPCHYEMFTFNTATTDEFVESCQRIGQGFKVLRAGEIACF